ncbi:MAG: DUF4129 domain-containing protein [bacterium]|nr:DUF4129 domain-containing protein [bacterium]
MNKKQKKHHKSAIRMIEEAVHILRSAPGTLLSIYYLGSVPFVLGLLYFWADMSRSANAYEYSAVAAIGLSVLFVWMKFWQTLFMYLVSCQIIDETHLPWSLSRIISIVATQSLIQSTRFFVVPIASLLVIPFGYCYAFYQNVSAHNSEQGQSVKSTCQWAWGQAKLWPRQNHLLIGIYWLFGLVIFINVSITVVFIPQMAKTLFGFDSAFTLSGIYMLLNTTFWIVVLGLTYLLLDPFIKTTYVLRCFYGTALQSGEDLRTELRQTQSRRTKLATGLLIVCLCLAPMTAVAQQRTPVSPVELDRSIEETMARREFAWRLPRETIQPDEQKDRGAIAAAIAWMIEMVGKGLEKIGGWVKKLVEWLESLLPKPDSKTEVKSGNWVTPVRIVLIVLLVILLAVLAYIFIRIWQRRRPAPVEAVSAVSAPTPDLTDESIKADDLSTNRWLTLAREFADKGELRLAMRALYLATLAHLADHEMITIEVYKSNREYESELKRRAHEHPELISIFTASLNFFERVWYGMYRIVRADFDVFDANHQRMIAFAQK